MMSQFKRKLSQRGGAKAAFFQTEDKQIKKDYLNCESCKAAVGASKNKTVDLKWAEWER